MIVAAKHVELRVIEAAETIQILPAQGLNGGTSAWPEYVRDIDESYGYAVATYRRRASPGAIARMYETWQWVNNHPVEADRKLLYAWAFHKVRWADGVREFVEKSGMKPRTLRWSITRICTEIARRLMQEAPTCVSGQFDSIAEILAYESADSVANRPHRPPNHLMEADAKPRHLPQSPDHSALIERLTANAERHRRKRKRSKTGA